MSKNLIRFTLIAAVLVSAGCSRFCSKKSTPPPPTDTSGTTPSQPGEVKTPNYNGITVTRVVPREMSVGKGKEVKAGSTAHVKYTEWVYDPAALANQGPKVSEHLDKPVTIKIGAGSVIKGFEEGLKGMHAGGKRQLIIPAAEAYGDAGQPPKVPARAMIMIDVELVKVE